RSSTESHTLSLHDALPIYSIVTTTVDARGFDRNRKQVARRGNPQTGPFFVEGAEPGDTLLVHLDRIVPNREYGFCGSSVAPNVRSEEHTSELQSRENLVCR